VHGASRPEGHRPLIPLYPAVQDYLATIAAERSQPGRPRHALQVFSDVSDVRGSAKNLQLNNAAPRGDGDGLGAVACAELLHDVLHVGFHSMFRNEENVCNVPIAVSAGDVPQNINLTTRQCFIAELFSRRGSDLRGNAFLAGMNLSDDIYYLSRRHILEDVRASPRLKCALNRAIAFKCRHHNDTGIRKLGLNSNHRVDSTHIRQPQVHQSDVRLQASKLLDCIASIRILSYQDHVRLVPDYNCQSFQQQRMIIDSQNADLS